MPNFGSLAWSGGWKMAQQEINTIGSAKKIGFMSKENLENTMLRVMAFDKAP